jgi:hypothetical protein
MEKSKFTEAQILNVNWFLSLEDAQRKLTILGGNTTISIHTTQSMN